METVVDCKFLNVIARHTFLGRSFSGGTLFFAATCSGITTCCAALCGAERLSRGS